MIFKACVCAVLWKHKTLKTKNCMGQAFRTLAPHTSAGEYKVESEQISVEEYEQK
jgi:hypothetical protein